MFRKVESKTWLKTFFMFIIYAFQKPADGINGCHEQLEPDLNYIL